MTSAAASEPSGAQVLLQVRTLRVAAKEPDAAQVAGAGRVDEPVDRVGVDHEGVVARDDHRAVRGSV